MQSALAPAGPAAQAIASLTTVLATGALVVLLLVMALVAYGALSGPRRATAGLWVIGGGIVFPVVVLSALLVYDRSLTVAHGDAHSPAALTIAVEGRQWWWEVRYPPAADGGSEVVSANELHVPVGVEIELALSTSDVIHSFWVPSLAGKVDMLPGRRTRLLLRADREGVYRGQCAEFCGVQHAGMALLVVAVSRTTFEAWRAREAQPAAPPTTPEGARGHDTFLAQGCAGCHTIRGTAALGRLGPDLTHVGGRRTLAAATIGNHRDAMAAWVTDGDLIKPGNRMPSYRHLDQESIAAIADYLVGLQ